MQHSQWWLGRGITCAGMYAWVLFTGLAQGFGCLVKPTCPTQHPNPVLSLRPLEASVALGARLGFGEMTHFCQQVFPEGKKLLLPPGGMHGHRADVTAPPSLVPCHAVQQDRHLPCEDATAGTHAGAGVSRQHCSSCPCTAAWGRGLCSALASWLALGQGSSLPPAPRLPHLRAQMETWPCKAHVTAHHAPLGQRDANK